VNEGSATQPAENDLTYDSDEEPDRFELQIRKSGLDEKGLGAGDTLEDDDFVHATLKKNTPPWLGAIKQPTDAPPNVVEAPTQKLQIEWVYGYRSDDVFNNLGLDSKGRVVYPAAAVVVAYDAKSHSQVHNTDHTDDILCLAQNPTDKNWFATGQTATIDMIGLTRQSVDPRVVLWNSVTGESKVIKSSNKKATRAIGWSTDGKYIACAGWDQKCTVNVFDVASTGKVASLGADELPNKINAVVWGPDNQIVTVGVKHLFSWSFDGASLTKKRVLLDGQEPQSFYVAAWTSASSFVAGGKDGKLMFFNQKDSGSYEFSKAISAHDGGITALCIHGQSLVSGGKNRQGNSLNVYSLDGQEQKKLATSSYPRAVSSDGKNLVAGLREGKIVYFAGASGSEQCWVQGHWDGELWGIDMDPTNGNRFVTVGEDNQIVSWDKKTHKLVKSSIITSDANVRRKRTKAATLSSQGPNRCARAVAISSTARVMAIGLNDGHLALHNADTLEQIDNKDLNQYGQRNVQGQEDNWIQALQFSPDGKALAVGTHGSTICLLETSGWEVQGSVKSHHAAITNLDWAADSTSIQSNCLAYELLFTNVNTDMLSESKQNPHADQMKDVKWASQTCKMGWAVRGIWEQTMDGSDINNCDRSPDGSLIVSADDWGRLNLYRYPVGDNNEKTSYDIGHSSHVVNARFTKDGQHIISTGGYDKCIIQWKVIG